MFSFWTLSHSPYRCVDDLMLELNFGLKQRDRLFAFLALKRVHTRKTATYSKTIGSVCPFRASIWAILAIRNDTQMEEWIEHFHIYNKFNIPF